MSKSTLNPNKKLKRGRPPVNTEQIGIRMELDLFSALDGYRSALPDTPQRTEAIRRILREWLSDKGYL